MNEIDKKDQTESEIVDARYRDFYEKMRHKIYDWLNKKGVDSKYSGYLMLAPDLFYLIVKLIQDPRVPVIHKAKLGAVLLYFISPVDLMPEAILGPIGFADDVALTAYALNSIVNRIDQQIVRDNWPGDDDILIVLKNVITKADETIGSGLIKKIKKMLG